MKKIRRLIIAILLPVFLGLFITQFFYTHFAIRLAEYIVDAILLVAIGFELFAKKK